MGPKIAHARVAAFKERKLGADTAFMLAKGDSVNALESRVRPTSPGLIVARAELRLSIMRGSDSVPTLVLTVPAGDTLYITDFSAEATEIVVWHRGKAFAISEGLYPFEKRQATPKAPYDVLSTPEEEWWVRIRNQKGVEGWVLNPYDFAGATSCGG